MWAVPEEAPWHSTRRRGGEEGVGGVVSMGREPVLLGKWETKPFKAQIQTATGGKQHFQASRTLLLVGPLNHHSDHIAFAGALIHFNSEI